MPTVTRSLETLSREECFDVLRRGRVGRIAVTMQAMPVILPVAYAMLGEDIVFRTGSGTKLLAAARNAVVGFEVDDIDEDARTGVSVLAIGQAGEILDPGELARARRLDLDTWVPGPLDHYVRVPPLELTGRRIRSTEG